MIGFLDDPGLTMDDQGYLTTAANVPIDQVQFEWDVRPLSTKGVRP